MVKIAHEFEGKTYNIAPLETPSVPATQVKEDDLRNGDGFKEKALWWTDQMQLSVVGTQQGMFKSLGGLMKIAGDHLVLTPNEQENLVQKHIGLGSTEEMARKKVNLITNGSLGKSINKIGEKLQLYGDTARKYWEKESEATMSLRDPTIFSGDFIENPSWTRAFSSIASAVPSLGSAIITSAVAGTIFAGYGLGSLEAEEIYDRALTEGKTEEEALKLFGITTAGVGSLEAIGLEAIGGRFIPKAFKKTVLGRLFSNAVIGGAGEGLTESGQELFQNMVTITNNLDSTREWWHGLAESFIAGFGSGAGMGGAVGVETQLKTKKKQAEFKKFLKDNGMNEKYLDAAITAIEDSVINNADTLEESVGKFQDKVQDVMLKYRDEDKKTVLSNIEIAEKAGTTDPETAKLAKYLVSEVDQDFDKNSSIEFSAQVKKATEDIARDEGVEDPAITTGETVSKMTKDVFNTAIKLYRGHDADTLIEEWYHRGWDRLSAEEKQVYQDYHKKTGDTRSVHEHFAQEGRDLFFSEKLHEKAGGVKSLFRRFRTSLKSLINRVRKLRGANIPKNILDTYRKVGTQKAGKTGAKVDPLIEEAKKYKSAEDFINFMRGSATQYRGYNPKLRATQKLFEDSARISELGIDPEMEVTIYRGVPDPKNKKIVDGDFVVTDIQSAESYAGKDNVISKKVKAKDLIADLASDFDVDEPFGLGAEFVYSGSKNKLEYLTDKQLTDIWNKAHGKKATQIRTKESLKDIKKLGIEEAKKARELLKETKQELRKEYKSMKGMRDKKATERRKTLRQQKKEIQKDIEALKPGFVEIRERLETNINRRLRDIEMGIAEGKRVEIKEAKETLRSIRDLVNNSELNVTDRRKILAMMPKALTQEQFEKNKGKIYEQMRKALMQTQKRNILDKISKELKRTKPVKKGTRKKGKYDYESNMQFVELRRIDKLNKTEALNELQSMGEPESEFDKIKTKLLNLKANGIQHSSPTLMISLLSDIQMMKVIGEAVKTNEDFDKAIERQELIEDVLSRIEKTKGDAKSVKTKIVNIYRKGATNIYSMLNSIAGKDVAEALAPDYYEAQKQIAVDKKLDRIYDRAKPIIGVKNKNQFSKWIGRLQGNKYVLTNQNDGRTFDIGKWEIVDMYLGLKNSKTRQDFYDAYGQTQIDNFVDMLTQEEKTFADIIQQEAQEYYDVFNQRHIRDTGHDLGIAENYWPASNERVFEDVYDEFRQQSQIPSPTFSRVKGKVTPIAKNAWHKFMRHVEQAEHENHMSAPYEALKRITENKRIQNKIDNKFGKYITQNLKGKIDDIALNKITKQMDIFNSLYDKMLSNWTVAKIGSPTVFAKQLISVINYSEDMSVFEWTKGFFEGIAHPKRTMDYMFKEIPYLKTRFERGYSEDIKKAIEDAESAIKTKRLRKKLINAVSFLTRTGDIGAIVYGGYPMYKNALKNNSKKVAEKKFVDATLRSQQSGLYSSLADVQKARGFTRSFFMFSNTKFQYTRKQVDALISWSNGDISFGQLSKVMAIYGVAQPTLYALLGTVLGSLLYRDDELEGEKILSDIMMELVTNPFKAIPLVTEIIRAGVRQMSGENVYKVFNTPILDDLTYSFYKMKSDDFELGAIMEFLLTTSAELTAGLPVKIASKIFNKATGNV